MLGKGPLSAASGTYLIKRTHFGTDRRLWFIKKTKYPRKVERVPIKIGTQPVEIE